MESQSQFIAALKKHKRWADIASIASVVLVIGLLYVTAYLADSVKADDTSRIGMYITMVAVITVVCIWQAAAYVVASIEISLRDRQGERGPWD